MVAQFCFLWGRLGVCMIIEFRYQSLLEDGAELGIPNGFSVVVTDEEDIFNPIPQRCDLGVLKDYFELYKYATQQRQQSRSVWSSDLKNSLLCDDVIADRNMGLHVELF